MLSRTCCASRTSESQTCSMVTSEQHLWIAISEKPGSCVKKSFVTSQLALPCDEDSTAWLMDRPHLFQVQFSCQHLPMMANTCC